MLPNPYGFVAMETWWSYDDVHTAFVGTTADGTAYLTWDVRDGVPVFSPGCRVGDNPPLTPEYLARYREVFLTDPCKRVKTLDRCRYTVLGHRRRCGFNPPPPSFSNLLNHFVYAISRGHRPSPDGV